MTCRMYYGFNSLRSALRVIPIHRWVKQSNWLKVGRGMNGGKSRKEGGKKGRGRKAGRMEGRKESLDALRIRESMKITNMEEICFKKLNI